MLRRLELRLVKELAEGGSLTQMSFIIEELMMSFIAQRALHALPRNSVCSCGPSFIRTA